MKQLQEMTFNARSDAKQVFASDLMYRTCAHISLLVFFADGQEVNHWKTELKGFLTTLIFRTCKKTVRNKEGKRIASELWFSEAEYIRAFDARTAAGHAEALEHMQSMPHTNVGLESIDTFTEMGVKIRLVKYEGYVFQVEFQGKILA